jgi:tetratricopeptide (TPR) repeat protein
MGDTMVKEASCLYAARALVPGVRGSCERTGVEMKLSRRTTSVPDRALNRLLGVAVLTLALGIPTFGVIYYRDQHVDAGPTLIERQVQTAEQAVRKAPDNIGLRLQLAQVYQSTKQLDIALKQYDEILTVDATNRMALLGRGDVLVAKGDLTKAAASFQKVITGAKGGEFSSADPQLQKAQYSLGQIALMQGRAKDAVASLQAAIKIDPTDADALYLLGTADLKTGAPERAVVDFQRALAFVPTGWCEPYSQLSQAFKKLGRTPNAEYAGAMVDFCQKRPADAKRRLQTLTSGPVAVDAMLGLGMIAEKESDRTGAISWYQKVLGADAKNFDASTGLNRLGAGKTS